MYRLVNVFILICCICLIIPICFTGCKTSGIPAEEIPITIEPCQDDPEGDISFSNVTVAKGVLDKEYYYKSSTAFQAGEMCFLVSGKINNNSSTGYFVTYSAYGYDNTGKMVAYTLDAGPIIGLAVAYLDAASTEDFTLHLTWSENTAYFVLYSGKSIIPPP